MRMVLMLIVMFSFGVLAQVAAPAPPTYLDSILAFISSPGVYLTSLLAVVDFVMRRWPSAIPLSVLVPIKYAVLGIAKILEFLASSILDYMINLGQNIQK